MNSIYIWTYLSASLWCFSSCNTKKIYIHGYITMFVYRGLADWCTYLLIYSLAFLFQRYVPKQNLRIASISIYVRTYSALTLLTFTKINSTQLNPIQLIRRLVEVGGVVGERARDELWREWEWMINMQTKKTFTLHPSPPLPSPPLTVELEWICLTPSYTTYLITNADLIRGWVRIVPSRSSF